MLRHRDKSRIEIRRARFRHGVDNKAPPPPPSLSLSLLKYRSQGSAESPALDCRTDRSLRDFDADSQIRSNRGRVSAATFLISASLSDGLINLLALLGIVACIQQGEGIGNLGPAIAVSRSPLADVSDRDRIGRAFTYTPRPDKIVIADWDFQTRSRAYGNPIVRGCCNRGAVRRNLLLRIDETV